MCIVLIKFDRNWFKELIAGIVGRIFHFSWTKEEIFTTPVLFSDILKLDIGQSVYEEVVDH